MKHKIEIDFHDTNKAIENICILGSMIKDKKAKEYLQKLDAYIQDIWSKSKNKQLKLSKQ